MQHNLDYSLDKYAEIGVLMFKKSCRDKKKQAQQSIQAVKELFQEIDLNKKPGDLAQPLMIEMLSLKKAWPLLP